MKIIDERERIKIQRKSYLICKLNLELALLIILKETESYESKHVALDCRCLKM